MLRRVHVKERRELAQKIWGYRKENGLTQDELAKRFRLSRRTIQRAEYGNSVSMANFHSLKQLVGMVVAVQG